MPALHATSKESKEKISAYYDCLLNDCFANDKAAMSKAEAGKLQDSIELLDILEASIVSDYADNPQNWEPASSPITNANMREHWIF